MEKWLHWFKGLSRRMQVSALLGSGGWFLFVFCVLMGTHPKIDLWRLQWLYTSPDGSMSGGFSWLGIIFNVSGLLAFVAINILVRIVPSPGESKSTN